MAPALHATPRAAAMAFVAGVLAVTAFGIVVAGDSPSERRLAASATPSAAPSASTSPTQPPASTYSPRSITCPHASSPSAS
ncbi:hypothetical protein ACFQL4_22235 [Halosimplex aquaticum]